MVPMPVVWAVLYMVIEVLYVCPDVGVFNRHCPCGVLDVTSVAFTRKTEVLNWGEEDNKKVEGGGWRISV